MEAGWRQGDGNGRRVDGWVGGVEANSLCWEERERERKKETEMKGTTGNFLRRIVVH